VPPPPALELVFIGSSDAGDTGVHDDTAVATVAPRQVEDEGAVL